MRYVFTAIVVLMVAAVAVTPRLRDRAEALVAGLSGTGPPDPTLTAQEALRAIPDRVLARLALPRDLEPAIGPEVGQLGVRLDGPLDGGEAGRKAGEPEAGMGGEAPSILVTSLSDTPIPESDAAVETDVAPEPQPAPMTVASLPPIDDPLHEDGFEWLSSLQPAAPRDLLEPDTDEPADDRQPEKQEEAPPAPVDGTDDRARDRAPAGPDDFEKQIALFGMPLATAAGPDRADQVAAAPATGDDGTDAGPGPDAARVFVDTPLAAAPLPRSSADALPRHGAVYVVIGSFLKAEYAAREMRRHTDWQPSVRRAEVDGKHRLRVVVGPFGPGDWPAALARIRAEAVADAWPLPTSAGPELALRGLDLLG